LADHQTKKRRETTALAEVGVAQQPFQLLLDRFFSASGSAAIPAAE
jgi:hypothetical protein